MSTDFRPTPRSSIARRSLLALGSALAFAPLWVHADTYPSKTIHVIVGFVPGGATDFGARLAAAALADVLKVAVVVENRPGATGMIASEYVSRASPDGYTLLVGTPTPIIVAPQVIQGQTFNALKDLTAVNMFSQSPIALAVNPKLGVKTIKDLVALSRQRVVTIGTSGLGGTLHIFIESLKQQTGGNFQVVPYKGTGPSVTDAMAGHIDATVSDVGPFVPLHNEGKLLIIGLATDKRIPLLPNVPTLSEEVPGFVMSNWLGVFAPPKTPANVIEALSVALQKAAAREDVRKQLNQNGYTASPMPSAAEFQKFVATEYGRYGKLIKDNKIVMKE